MIDDSTIDKLIQLFSTTTDDALYAYFAYLGLSTLNNVLVIGALIGAVVYIARLVYKAHVPDAHTPWQKKTLRAAYETTRTAWLTDDTPRAESHLYKAYDHLYQAMQEKGERV